MGPKIEHSTSGVNSNPVSQSEECRESTSSDAAPTFIPANLLLPSVLEQLPRILRLDLGQSRAFFGAGGRIGMDIGSKGGIGVNAGFHVQLDISLNRYLIVSADLSLPSISYLPAPFKTGESTILVPALFGAHLLLFPGGYSDRFYLFGGGGFLTNLASSSVQATQLTGGAGYRWQNSSHAYDVRLGFSTNLLEETQPALNLPSNSALLSFTYFPFVSEPTRSATKGILLNNYSRTPIKCPLKEEVVKKVEAPGDVRAVPKDIPQTAPLQARVSPFERRLTLFRTFLQEKEAKIAELKKALPNGILGSTEIDLLERSIMEMSYQFQLYSWTVEHQNKKPILSDETLLRDLFDTIYFETKKELSGELGLSSASELDNQIQEERQFLQSSELQTRISLRQRDFAQLIARESYLRDRTIYRQASPGNAGDTDVVAYKPNEFFRIYYENIIGELKVASYRSSHLSFLVGKNNPDQILRRIESQPWMVQLNLIASTTPADRVEYRIKGDGSHETLLESALLTGVMFIPRYGHPIGMAITAAELLRIHLQNKDLFGNNATPRRGYETDFNAGMMALAAIPKVGKPLAAGLAFAEFTSIAQSGKDLAGNEVSNGEAALSGVVALMSALALAGRERDVRALTQKLNGYLKEAQASHPGNVRLAHQEWVDRVARDLRKVLKEDPAVLQEAIDLLKKDKSVGSRLRKIEEATAKLYPKAKSVSRPASFARSDEPPIIPDLPGRRVKFYQDYALRYVNPIGPRSTELGSDFSRAERAPVRLTNLKGSNKPFGAGTYRPRSDENATFIKPVEASEFKTLLPAEVRRSPAPGELEHVDQTVTFLQQKGMAGEVRLQHKGKTGEQIKYKELGKGGMATVYEGKFIPKEGEKPFDVAIKVYDRPELLRTLPVDPAHRLFSPISLQLDEAANIARFWEKGMGPGYVNIIQLEDGRIGIVMKKIQGIHEDDLKYAQVFKKVQGLMPKGTDPKDIHRKVGEVFDSLAEQYRKQLGVMTNEMKIQLPDSQAVSEIDLSDPNLARLTFMDLARVENISPYRTEAMNAQNNAWVDSFLTRKYGEKLWEGVEVSRELRIPGMPPKIWNPQAVLAKAKLPQEQIAALKAVTDYVGNKRVKVLITKDALGDVRVITLDLQPGNKASRAPITINKKGVVDYGDIKEGEKSGLVPMTP